MAGAHRGLSRKRRYAVCERLTQGSIARPRNTFAEDNFLFRGQEVAVEIDEADITNQSLRPGQMSLHHGRMFHRSRPNQSDSRRVGITARFVTPDVVPELLGFDYAMLVSGENRSDHFRLVPAARVHPGRDRARVVRKGR